MCGDGWAMHDAITVSSAKARMVETGANSCFSDSTRKTLLDRPFWHRAVCSAVEGTAAHDTPPYGQKIETVEKTVSCPFLA